MSFATRILLTSLVVLAVGLGALVVAGNVLLDVRVSHEASSQLRSQAEAERAALDVRGTRVTVRERPQDAGAALDRHAWVLAGDGGAVVERAQAADPELDALAIRLGRERAFGEHDGDDDVLLRVEPIVARGRAEPVGAVVVAMSTESLETLQQLVLVGSLVVALLVLVAGGIALRSAIARALAPVARMTEDAEDWGAHDLDRRFGLGPPRDELTGLAATLDGLLARIAASRRHEQRFAAEVAHELRTPLAGVMGRAELALGASGPGADAEREAALRAVVAQGQRLTETVDTLLAVARRELDPEDGAVDLVALAREVPDAEVRVLGVLPAAEGDADVVRRALAPLVDNARRHAASAVRLELSAGDGHVRLAVRDDGPGVDPALGDRVFDPGVSGADSGGGAGLGLPLARRLARSCGGDVVLGDGPGGDVVLVLPAAPR